MIPIRLVAPENPVRAVQAVGEALLGASGLANWVLFPARVKKKPGEYEVQASLPGVEREDIDVEVSGRWLHIRVRRPSSLPLGRTSLRRSFPIPYEVEIRGIAAVLELGVLTVRLPMSTGSERRVPVSEPPFHRA